jgi:hypothetical protein
MIRAAASAGQVVCIRDGTGVIRASLPGSHRPFRIISMNRVEFISHQGVRILQIDYGGLSAGDELQRVIEEASAAICSEPPGSVLAIIDLAGLRYSLRAMRMLSERGAENAPHIRGRAVIGLPPVAIPAMEEVGPFTSRPIRAFESREEALDWLAELATEPPPEDAEPA